MRSRKLETVRIHDAIAAIGEIFGDQFTKLGCNPGFLNQPRVLAGFKSAAP
jgi:hypothetical protein